MQIGDLVQRWHGNDVGIILWQIGVIDRWFIQWANGEAYAINGYALEVIV